MANWTGVITNAGNNVLLEWINEKTLHFDSAAAGQGTVETVGMLAQTALVNQKQVASIIGAERVSKGIRLKIRITAPQAAYTLNQYGVWASITGGSTTMIALFQHEKGIPIPSAAESPDFVYTFYALISTSNTGKWTVNIDTSASVTLEEMNAAIATAVATKEGLIKDASQKASLADADCIAVVDSADGGKTKRVLWSTVKAVLAKLFVPQTRKINNKPLSADVTLTGEDIKVTGSDETTIHTRLSEITNPNLLDNWYFGNPVNQRAASEYSGSWSYCIDRWVAEGIITVGKEGVSASSRDASNPAYFLQRFEHFPDGRQVTFSLLTDNKLYAITGVKNGEMGFSKTFDDGVILSVEHGTPVYAAVSFPPGKTYQMIATKLEFGSQQTLAHQENGKWVLNEIPDYGEQLAKCQRYYCTSYQNGPVGTPEKYLNEIVMTAISQINFSTREIQFPQTMRTTPAITFYSPVTGKVGKAAKAGGGEVDIKEMIGGKNRMSFFCSSNNLDIGYEYYVHYSASADL